MTHRFGRVAGVLGCALILTVACGGSSFEAVEGEAGGTNGGSDGGGGKASGGAEAGSMTSAGVGEAGSNDGGVSTNGGTSTGGTNNGGVSSGGVTNGGVSSGGVTNGGVSSGGANRGGANQGGAAGATATCNEDSDCVACAYPTAPTKTLDCYCASCASTPRSKSACSANQAAWETYCSKAPLSCPLIACVEPPVPACKSHMCVAQ